MTKPQPQAQDWNSYWGREQTQQFTQISWSKKRIISRLNPYLVKGKNALDAGCGSGFFSKHFCDSGMQTVSLDYSQEALAIAREKTQNRAQLLKKDLLHEQLAHDVDERFHLIFTDGLLEHFTLSEQNKILQNFISVLDQDGVIVTFVPNKWSPWELIRPFYMPGIEEDPFVLKDLIHLHESQGLRIVESGGLNTFPFAFSPDRLCGRWFGMLLYVVAQKK